MGSTGERARHDFLRRPGPRPNRGSGDHAYAAQIRGVKSAVSVWTTDACQRISSVWVEPLSPVGFYEFGYVVGWSNCDHQWHDQPTIFAWWQWADSSHANCRIWDNGNPVVGQADWFRASDIDGDFRWGGWWNGIEEQPGAQGIVTDFDRGRGVVNTERGGPNDSGSAHWNNVQEYHPSNAWTPFDNLTGYVDRDPDYKFSAVAPDEGKAIKN